MPPLFAGCGEAGGRQHHPPRLISLCFASAAGQASRLGTAPELSQCSLVPPGPDTAADLHLHARSRECSSACISCQGRCQGAHVSPTSAQLGEQGCAWHPRHAQPLLALGTPPGWGLPVLTCRCSSPSAASLLLSSESHNSTCNHQPLLFLYGHPQGYLLKPVVYWLCHGLLEVCNPFQGVCKKSLRKATLCMQCNSLGLCIFCTSDLYLHWEILGVYTLTNFESLWVTSPSAAGCSDLNN